MTEHFVCWAITDVSSYSPLTIQELRKRLTKMIKVAPVNASVTVTDEKTVSGSKYQQIRARWDVWV